MEVPVEIPVIPAPSGLQRHDSPYELTAEARVHVESPPDAAEEARRIATYLAALLRPATGFALPLSEGPEPGPGIRLVLDPRRGELGAEGYRLDSDAASVTLTAAAPAGLFHAVQTLRQLLPARVEHASAQSGPWRVPGVRITDLPRYGYRGAMLDVARHFLTVEQVERYLDHLALYKFNVLHLHLSDDQGWRLAIDSWPRLATHGGAHEVGGGPGGHYTKDDYRRLLAYAAERYVELVPEIDMPGHTHAALSSYAELNPGGVAPPPYDGIEVGFSTLDTGSELTYTFVREVLGELAALSPGRYLHIGGDEAFATAHEDYAAFMDRVQPYVSGLGRTVLAWHQLAGASPVPGAVAQYWGHEGTGPQERERVVAAARAGTRLVLSPADRIYLDMKYAKDTPLGLDWAGLVPVRRAYDWDPAGYLEGAPRDAVLGVEAPLWTETLASTEDLEFMAFPRLPGAAELGWSPQEVRDWETYRVRLAAQAARWDALGITYHRAPDVPWS